MDIYKAGLNPLLYYFPQISEGYIPSVRDLQKYNLDRFVEEIGDLIYRDRPLLEQVLLAIDSRKDLGPDIQRRWFLEFELNTDLHELVVGLVNVAGILRGHTVMSNVEIIQKDTTFKAPTGLVTLVQDSHIQYDGNIYVSMKRLPNLVHGCSPLYQILLLNKKVFMSTAAWYTIVTGNELPERDGLRAVEITADEFRLFIAEQADVPGYENLLD